MRKKHSVRIILWGLLFVMMTLVFVIYMVCYVYFESSRIRSQASDALEQQVLSVRSFVDAELSALDTVMQNVAYSNLVKEYYLANLEQPDNPENGNYSSMQNAKVLTRLLTAIIGPNRPVDQIYLYALDGGGFGNGLDNHTSNLSVTEMDWYPDLIASDKNKIMFLDRDERLSRYFTYEEGSWFLTLCSVYQNNLYRPIGVIETKRSIAPLLRKLRSLDHKVYNESVFLYDPKGRVVYSSDSNDQADDYFALLRDNSTGEEAAEGDTGSSAGAEAAKGNAGSSTGAGAAGGKKAGSAGDSSSGIRHLYRNASHLFSSTSDYSGFTTVAVVSNRNLYAPLRNFLRINLLVFLGIITLTFLLSMIAARIITTPLMRIYNQLAGLYKTTDSAPADEKMEKIDTRIIELDTMYTALGEMHGRLQESMKREILLRNQELQSHMLALQAQMNPHFLYNSLATMQSLAEEENYEGVVRMCQMISRLLRYISSDKEPLVPVREEIAHARDYLECMKLRYEDDLEYEIDIPEEMMEIEIPKLCLQLIIENAIKFSTRSVRPPWIVKVTGIMDESHWEISISDNGSGFSRETLEDLEVSMRNIDETMLLPTLEIDGMGLMNVYIRFRTFYQGKQIFRIGNRPEGGAVITAGAEREKT